jgi:hypothetical protein
MEAAVQQDAATLHRLVCRARGRMLLVPVEHIFWFSS